MNIKGISLLIGFLVFIFNGFSQVQPKKELRSLEREASMLFENQQYQKALPLYLKLDSIKPNDGLYNVRIGMCYLDGDIAHKCLPYFQNAKSLNYTKEPLDYFIARAYHLNHRFDTAVVLYQIAKKTAVSKDHEADINRYIQNCKNGLELIKAPVKVTIQNIGPLVNTKAAEYAPVISGDENTLIFTSSRADTYGGEQDEFGNYFDDIYVTSYENGKWTTPKNIGPPINTIYHDATIGLSVDGQQLFIYQNDSITGSGDIFVSSLKNGKWSRPEKMPSPINSKAWEPGGSMIADENTFFFSSDKPGGFGGTDLYVCKKKANGKWSEPKNLGPKVNTPYDEDAPFIHPDSKTLYFSSTGHNSIGGFDVFTVQYNSEKDSIGIPENIGYPINTADDELFFVWSADGTRGYFSAAREEGFGDRDIYVIQRPSIEMNLILFSGKIKSLKKDHIPASIYVIDNATNKVVAHYDSTIFADNYTITLEPGKNYAIAVESVKHLTHSENINIPVNGFFELKKDIALHPLDEGGLIVLNNVFFDNGSSDLKKESFGELDRYYETLKNNPDLFVEIASHAFDYNDHSANAELSQKRAEAVVDYLVKKGINPEMLRAMGYGDRFKLLDDDSEEARNANTRTELVILDKLKKGESKKKTNGFYNDKVKEGITDIVAIRNEEFKSVEVKRDSENRQEAPKEKYLVEKEKDVYFAENAIELKKVRLVQEKVKTGILKPVLVKGIVKEGESGKPVKAKVQLLDLYGNLISETTTKEDGLFQLDAYNAAEKKHSIAVHKEGYKYDSKDFTLPANSGEKIEVVQDLTVYKLIVGSKFRLRNIYFDYNKASLKKESSPELNKLVKLLKQNPDLVIEVAGHTDSKGAARYNRKLSQSRCDNVVSYLIKNGVPKARLKPVGYGEEKPLASNDDEEEGREFNRRIEFEVLKGL